LTLEMLLPIVSMSVCAACTPDNSVESDIFASPI
jgi:hypothetical protein